jgi:hypothetical protein
VNLGFTGAFVAIAAIGIVQAHLAFVPESAEKKKRELPPLGVRPSSEARSAKAELSLSEIAPIVSPLTGRDGTPSGIFLGLRGVVF